mgnify:CR=1 FL=1
MSASKTVNRKPTKVTIKQNKNAVRRLDQNRPKHSVAKQARKQKTSPVSARAGTATKDSCMVRPGTKLAMIIDQLRQPGGTTIQALSEATGWQRHSVRGALSGTLHTKMGLNVQSQRQEDGVRTYRIVV